jgi:uncharacterized membrane protein
MTFLLPGMALLVMLAWLVLSGHVPAHTSLASASMPRPVEDRLVAALRQRLLRGDLDADDYERYIAAIERQA